jgi:hypothetical protein
MVFQLNQPPGSGGAQPPSISPLTQAFGCANATIWVVFLRLLTSPLFSLYDALMP